MYHLCGGSASKRADGELWPLTHGEDAAFCPCSPRMDSSHGAGGCRASPWGDGGCMGRCVLAQNTLHLRNVAHPLGATRGHGPGSSAVCVCTNQGDSAEISGKRKTCEAEILSQRTRAASGSSEAGKISFTQGGVDSFVSQSKQLIL